jgi:DNA-binding winged helix-turn-helix (wHTH) protein
MDSVPPLPLTFRENQVTEIMNALRAGESCSVVGIGSVGKSNLVRFLEREDVREKYLGEACKSFLFVYLDGNKLLKRSFWALTELMLHQMLLTLTERRAEEELLSTMEDLHQKAVARKTRFLSARHLDRAVSIVRRRLGVRVVFLMDEFDDLFPTLSARGFSMLRALRDDHKYGLMYLVATRLEWARLRDNPFKAEAFEELVSAHTIWLGPYAEQDARDMLNRLQARRGTSVDLGVLDQILKMAGGHPGLLRAAHSASAKRHSASLASTLARSTRVQDECRRIWHSLSESEQEALTALAGKTEVASHLQEALSMLRRKGIVGGPWAVNSGIFARLLDGYIQSDHPAIGSHIYVDEGRNLVSINGRDIRDLTPLEFKLFAYLHAHLGQTCQREDLLRIMYEGEKDIDPQDNRLDATIKRLRKKVEPVPNKPRYILTKRGFGYCLVDVG